MKVNAENTEKTVVVFRRWPKKEGGRVCALFPYDPSSNDGFYCNSYEHIGGHGGADYSGMIRRTKPVKKTDPDVLDLIKELRRIGYNLAIRRKATNDFKKRLDVLESWTK